MTRPDYWNFHSKLLDENSCGKCLGEKYVDRIVIFVSLITFAFSGSILFYDFTTYIFLLLFFVSIYIVALRHYFLFIIIVFFFFSGVVPVLCAGYWSFCLKNVVMNIFFVFPMEGTSEQLQGDEIIALIFFFPVSLFLVLFSSSNSIFAGAPHFAL